jgi:hypothetical protein
MPTNQIREDNANHIRGLKMQYIQKNWAINDALAQESETEGDMLMRLQKSLWVKREKQKSTST